MIAIEFSWKALISLKLSPYIPTPDFCFSLAPYPFTAALIGAGYGMTGRILNSERGMAPLPYAVCFEVAYQIKQCFYLLARFFDLYFKKLKERQSQEYSSQKGSFFLQLRSAYDKGIQLQAAYFRKFDRLFSQCVHIRSYEEMNSSSLSEASWLEVCRHRLWEDLKITLINTCSLSLAYGLCDCVGLILPYRKLSFLVLIIQFIAFEILIMPAFFYLYHRIKSYSVKKLLFVLHRC